MSKLTSQFFQQKASLVAKSLIGKVLVRRVGKNKISGIIVETEAYIGSHDLACHASKGKTERTKVMFEKGGIWYVYFIYGMYFNLNIVTENENCPTAVLIRSIEPLEGAEEMKKNRKTDNFFNLTSGPGKLCQALKIDKSFNATSATSKNTELYIEDRGIKISPREIEKAKRIGIDYSGIWKDKLLRFYLKGNPFVSKKD
ncbi:MAG: hypothetical protein ACD_15C00138G0016 [uncultured bacterium]|nr:MAG: hypothetical protein ACD_15C00138G0016 [uncultured bacterium]HCU71166.1 DNA-3-methyladenine glycosylase [Candidatus Moranbacteria bacterium]